MRGLVVIGIIVGLFLLSKFNTTEKIVYVPVPTVPVVIEQPTETSLQSSQLTQEENVRMYQERVEKGYQATDNYYNFVMQNDRDNTNRHHQHYGYSNKEYRSNNYNNHYCGRRNR